MKKIKLSEETKGMLGAAMCGLAIGLIFVAGI